MFKENYIIQGKIVCKTGLHIGGSSDAIDIGGSDNVIIRDPITGNPYIPGSSLKGKLRFLTELNDKDSAQSVINNNGKPADEHNCLSAKLFGIELPENFNKPFESETITEFWRRWHITLGTWLKKYIFYPIMKSEGFQKMSKTGFKKNYD